MKVLVFTSLYPNNIWPNHGVFIKERITHVAKSGGCEIKVVAPVPYFPPFKINWRWSFSRVLPVEIRDGIEVYHPRYYMIPKVGMSLYGFMLFLSVLHCVRQIRKTFDFDLIDAHFIYPDGFAAVMLSWFFQTPLVVSARGSDINLYSHFPVIRKILQYTLRKANRVIAVCQALKDAMVLLGVAEEKIAVVPNGVDHNKFFPIPKQEARKKLGLPCDKKIILSVGGLVPRKGFDILVKALKRLTSEANGKNDLFLVIVGEGPSRSDLEKLIHSMGLDGNVHLAGNIPHHALNEWYSAADIFCLASDREGWPNVIMESLACGTPVVATNIWGIPEIVRSSDIGLLTPRHENNIAKTLQTALTKQWDANVIMGFAKNATWQRVALSVRHEFESIEFPAQRN